MSILRTYPEEKEAFHSKLVCLIQLGRFDDGLAAIDAEAALATGLVFEKGYCEYRLNHTDDALRTLKASSQPDLRCKELLAQIYYRLEDFETAESLYRDVMKNSQDDYDDERQTNFTAVQAALSAFSETPMKTPDFDDSSYEVCYNAACFLIGQEDFIGAENKLKLAEELCKKSLDEDGDLTEEEREDELSLIRIQLAYCAQRLGQVQNALKIYNKVLKQKPSDAVVAAVAANNAVSLNKDQNVFDSKKKMKLATSVDLKKKLTSTQQEVIAVNQCLLHLHSNQADACRNQCKSLRQKCKRNHLPLLTEASLLCKLKQASKAVDLIQDYVKEENEVVLEVHLALAQVLFGQGNVTQTCAVLRTLGPNTYRPAIVSLLVSLYMSCEDMSAVDEFFTDVITWYDKNEAQSSSFKDILKASAEFQLKNDNPKTASSLLEKLKKISPGDRAVLSKLFAAYSQFDAKKAKQISNELPSVESLAEDVDVDKLEATAFSSSKYKLKKQDDKSAVTESGDAQVVKKKAKKRKKGKLPKEYNKDVDPDPERWLPRRERSTFRGKRRDKRKEGVGKGSQGATASGGPELDVTKMESVAEAPTNQPQGPRGKYSAKQQQKKKRKGKK